MTRHPHHFKIALALAISAGAWGIYWLPQRILEEGGLTGGWGTIAQMIIGVLLLSPIAMWRKIKGRSTMATKVAEVKKSLKLSNSLTVLANAPDLSDLEAKFIDIN